MKKTTLTIILTSILAFSVSFGQERPRLGKLILGKVIKEKVRSGDIVRKDRPELSDETQEQVNQLKGKKEALHTKLKENIANLGEGATREEIKEATQAFKQENQDQFDEIKESQEALRGKIKEARPHRQDRPQLNMSDELKAKVATLKEKREEMKQSRQALREELKNASNEERKEIIAEYKETNKERHQEIKENTIALKEEIRNNVETEATRTSDL
jgi:cytochrome c556